MAALRTNNATAYGTLKFDGIIERRESQVI
jgi:hypothetical protein